MKKNIGGNNNAEKWWQDGKLEPQRLIALETWRKGGNLIIFEWHEGLGTHLNRAGECFVLIKSLGKAAARNSLSILRVCHLTPTPDAPCEPRHTLATINHHCKDHVLPFHPLTSSFSFGEVDVAGEIPFRVCLVNYFFRYFNFSGTTQINQKTIKRGVCGEKKGKLLIRTSFFREDSFFLGQRVFTYVTQPVKKEKLFHWFFPPSHYKFSQRKAGERETRSKPQTKWGEFHE